MGVLFIIAGLAFFFGRTNIQLFAWENMPEQGRGRIMPLCRCVGEVIVLSGLIFLMKGLWAGFSEHWLAGSIAAWLAAAGLDVWYTAGNRRCRQL